MTKTTKTAAVETKTVAAETATKPARKARKARKHVFVPYHLMSWERLMSE
jgi:hypothetical protein